MPKRENIEYLIRGMDLPKFLKFVYEDLLSYTFGRDERTIETCADIAHRGTHCLLKMYFKMSRQERPKFKEDIVKLIARCIEKLFSQQISTREEFDVWHKKTCEEIREVANTYNIPNWSEWAENGYTHGLAQLWLNSTIEYMLLMEKWDDHLEPIKKYLHVPAKHNTLNAASKEFGIKIINNQGQFDLYNGNTSKFFKLWDYNEYIKFQEELRTFVDCPIDWVFSLRSNNKDESKQ